MGGSVSMYNFLKYDDLKIISNDLSISNKFTLSGIVKNEMYNLPAFLTHYRQLGVERFIFIDDQSTDGTREYLYAQSDVMVLGSGFRFGDNVGVSAPKTNASLRIVTVWRHLLLEKFCLNMWSIHLDADEFICLPENKTIPHYVSKFEDYRFDAAWGVMLDVYPASIAKMKESRREKFLNTENEWYFDAVQHFTLGKKQLRLTYPGSRARLIKKYELGYKFKRRNKAIFGKIKSFFRNGRVPKYNLIHKQPLLRWRSGAYFSSNHKCTLEPSFKHLFPIKHFKFTGHLYEKIDEAVQSKAYYNASEQYNDMKSLITAMEADDASFLCEYSKRCDDPDVFRQSKNAIGLDLPLQNSSSLR
jgi:glycosyltransferase involved in cell wall biosynthesis